MQKADPSKIVLSRRIRSYYKRRAALDAGESSARDLCWSYRAHRWSDRAWCCDVLVRRWLRISHLTGDARLCVLYANRDAAALELCLVGGAITRPCRRLGVPARCQVRAPPSLRFRAIIPEPRQRPEPHGIAGRPVDRIGHSVVRPQQAPYIGAFPLSDPPVQALPEEA